MKKYNLNDEVWIWFDPSYINTPEDPIFTGTINEINFKTTLIRGDYLTETIENKEIEYVVSFGFDSTSISELRCYDTKEEAFLDFKKHMESEIKKKQKKVDFYKKILNDVEKRDIL